MASKEELRTLAGKALADPEFRQKLIDDPEGAIEEAGIELTPKQTEAFKEMDKEVLESGLAELDERLTMACWGKVQTPIGGGCAWD